MVAIILKCFYFYFIFPPAPLASRCYSHSKVETDEEFDSRWVTYFSKPDIDAWELRKGDPFLMILIANSHTDECYLDGKNSVFGNKSVITLLWILATCL